MHFLLFEFTNATKAKCALPTTPRRLCCVDCFSVVVSVASFVILVFGGSNVNHRSRLSTWYPERVGSVSHAPVGCRSGRDAGGSDATLLDSLDFLDGLADVFVGVPIMF